jgi:hypothetical protein
LGVKTRVAEPLFTGTTPPTQLEAELKLSFDDAPDHVTCARAETTRDADTSAARACDLSRSISERWYN